MYAQPPRWMNLGWGHHQVVKNIYLESSDGNTDTQGFEEMIIQRDNAVTVFTVNSIILAGDDETPK